MLTAPPLPLLFRSMAISVGEFMFCGSPTSMLDMFDISTAVAWPAAFAPPGAPPCPPAPPPSSPIMPLLTFIVHPQQQQLCPLPALQHREKKHYFFFFFKGVRHLVVPFFLPFLPCVSDFSFHSKKVQIKKSEPKKKVRHKFSAAKKNRLGGVRGPNPILREAE